METQARFTQGCIVEVTRRVWVPTWAQRELEDGGVEVGLAGGVSLHPGARGLLVAARSRDGGSAADVLIQGQVLAVNKKALKVVS